MAEPAISIDELLTMSIRLGIDMTPNNDITERLDALTSGTASCVRALEDVAIKLGDYEKSVKQ